MADIPTDVLAAPKPNAGDEARLPSDFELQFYKEANMYGRSIHDAVYKHAAISFTFNAILLAGLGPVIKADVAPIYQDFMPWLVRSLTVLGLIFNLGAFAAFWRLWKSWYEVHVLLRDFEFRKNDARFNLQVAIMGSKNASAYGPAYLLTCMFFTALLTFWCIVLYKIGGLTSA